nr:hypothetical protein [Ardenticatena sp.]
MRRVLFGLLVVLVSFLSIFAVSVDAYNRVQGQVIDSVNKEGWTYGGEVWVYDSNTGAVCATGTLDSQGGFSLALDGSEDFLGQGTTSCTTATNNGNTLVILIDFTCSVFPSNCGSPPKGTPGTITHSFTQNPLPVTYNAGYLETGTGPNSITLEIFSGSAATETSRLPVGALVGAMLLSAAGVVALVARRRR